MSKPDAKLPVLRNAFWTMDEKLICQRMTVAEWRAVLLAEKDVITRKGRLRKLVGKRIGPGVIEVRLEPLHD